MVFECCDNILFQLSLLGGPLACINFVKVDANIVEATREREGARSRVEFAAGAWQWMMAVGEPGSAALAWASS